MLRGIKRLHAEVATEIYNVYGNKPFTPPELHEKIGKRIFHGYIVLSMVRHHCVKEIDCEYFNKDRKRIRTYRLTSDMIYWLIRNGYITKPEVKQNDTQQAENDTTI